MEIGQSTVPVAILLRMDSRPDASDVPQWDADTLAAVHGSASDPALVDVDRENARSQIRARLFAATPEPVRFGRYVLLSNLGEGGTGMVYAAYDDKLDRKVAIKVLRPEIAAGETGAKRLLREARAVARLSDHNIVAVHEAGEQDGQVYISMEFIRGHNAAEWLRADDRSSAEILDAYRQAASGLIAAHRAGLVHRDFKPHNMLVGDDGVVKVVDFGLARAIGEADPDGPNEPVDAENLSPGDLEQTQLTRTGAILGTPAYMSPEQFQAATVDARSDQFSFCVALFQALYGTHPFLSGSLGELMASVCAGRVEDVKSPSVAPHLRRALLRGLSVAPDERFASMQELLDALLHDPASVRRRWITRGLLSAAVFGGGFALARLGTADEPTAELAPCDRGRGLVTQVWNETRRDLVRAAVLATERPFAPETWTRIDEDLTDYVDRWATTHDDACRQHRDGEQSGGLLDRRMACLQDAQAALDALGGVLEATDAESITHVMDAVVGLPSLSHCSDAEWLRADVAPPDDPRIAEQVQTERQTLARVQVLEHAGRWDEGRRLCAEVVEHARALDYPPLVAEAQLRRGSLSILRRDATDARDALEEALGEALRTGHTRVAAEALARRLFVDSELLGAPESARRDISIAQGLTDFVDHPGTNALLLNNIGAVYERLSDGERSRTFFEAAMRAQEQDGGSELLGVGVPLNNLATTLLSEDRHAEALERLIELGSIQERVYGASHPILLETHANQSALMASLYRFEESERLGRTTLRAQEATFGENSVNVLRALEALTELEVQRRRYEEALRWGTRAAEIAIRVHGPDSPIATGLKLRLARAQWPLGRRESARDSLQSAIETIRNALGPEHLYLAGAYWQYGELLRDESASEASRYLDQALAIFEAHDPGSLHVARCRISRARLHRSTGELDQAQTELEHALAAVDARLPDPNPVTATATWQLGEVLLERGAPKAALERLDRALEVHRALRDPEDPELAIVGFARTRALVALAEDEGTRPPPLDAELRGFADQLRAGGPGYREELDAVEAWRRRENDVPSPRTPSGAEAPAG